MKNLLISFSLLVLVCSCGQPTYQQPQYQTIPQPNGQQVVVVQDHDGTEFFMEMLMFQALMNNGGMGNVQGYYHSNRYAPEFQSQQTTYRTTVNNYYNENPTKRPEYKPSNGFGNSNGSGNANVNGSATQTTQPKVQYNPSNGFSQPTTTSPTPQPSKGFGTSKYVAPDVKTSTPQPSYKPSSGFGSSSGSSSTYKPSSGFGSKGSTTTSSSSSSYKSGSGFKKKN